VTEDAVPELGYCGPLQTFRRFKGEEKQVKVERRSDEERNWVVRRVRGGVAEGHMR
jgi:hypothetical protein